MTELIDRIIEAIKERDDPEQRENILRYFKEPIETFGTMSGDHKELAKQFYPEVKGDLPKAIQLTEELMKHRNLSVSSTGLTILEKFRKKLKGEHFKVFDGWVDYLTNWANTDQLCTQIIAETIIQEPAHTESLIEWTGSPNRWRRRAAAVSLVPIARKGLMLEQVFSVADGLMADGDEMVQKGVGWMLKEASKKHSEEVHGYLVRWKSETSALVLRYASEKLPAELKVYKTR